jgi:hypothetical protein
MSEKFSCRRLQGENEKEFSVLLGETMRRRKITKKDETRIDSYGRGEVLTDCKEPNAERELWCGVILQAIVNCRFKVKGWQDSLEFISGAGNWNWICTQLGMDSKRASRNALKAVFDSKNVIHKH